MAILMPGGPVGKALSEKTAQNAAHLKEMGVTATLEVIRVGQRPEDMAYERAAMKRAQAVGVQVRQTLLPADAQPEELVAALERVNRDDSVHGCLLFRPLPEQLSAPGLTETLCPEKDVDGMTAAGLGGLMTVERGGFAPCTAAACMEMLRHYRIPLRGEERHRGGHRAHRGYAPGAAAHPGGRHRVRLPPSDPAGAADGAVPHGGHHHLRRRGRRGH